MKCPHDEIRKGRVLINSYVLPDVDYCLACGNQLVTTKYIDGFEGLYSITSAGRVYSHRAKKYLKPRDNGKGYKKVRLMANGKDIQRPIYRLVAEAFLPNKHDRKEINHKDGIKDNDHLNNLEWSTRSENVKHAFKNGLVSNVGEDNPNWRGGISETYRRGIE